MPADQDRDDPLREIEWLGGEERTNYPFTLSVEDFGEALGLTAQVVDAALARAGLRLHAAGARAAGDALEHAPDTPVQPARCDACRERTLLLRPGTTPRRRIREELCVHSSSSSRSSALPTRRP